MSVDAVKDAVKGVYVVIFRSDMQQNAPKDVDLISVGAQWDFEV